MRWSWAVWALLLSLSGCSTNFLSGLDSSPSDPLGALRSAQRALDTGNYTAAIQEASSVVANPQANSFAKDNANVILAQAALGQKGFGLAGFAANLIQTVNSSTTTQAQFYNALKSAVGSLTAKDFQSANTSFQKLLSGSTVSSNISSDASLSAGVSEGLEAVLTMSETFDTDRNGDITLAEAQANKGSWSAVGAQVLTAADSAARFATASFGSSPSADQKKFQDAVEKADCQLKIVDFYCTPNPNQNLTGCSTGTVTSCEQALGAVDG